ncbi:nucleoside ABC transporter membrane protein [Rhizobium subbaraonis]|uniref:Nucleoside ABC transporter membrane protein n=1 Tax=Rhizobium subbaraonis TaxID=908946 RepID=A0A285UZ04_9HYPH|nr:ABC transporter permease [Rhizobium subbaraonis]SOC45966.1 nucleoside ABC transporter membrane protein [Rhizobium subbaraonis]
MDFLIGWIAIIPNYATPLVLASLGLIICERAGILNLGAEGLMAVGAMSAAIAVLSGGNPWAALVAGAASAMALAFLFGMATVVLRADQTLSGLAVVAIGLGVTGVVGRSYVQKTFVGIPNLGDIFALERDTAVARIVAVQDPITLALPVMVGLLWWWLMRSRSGLRLRAVGENPAAADVAGVDVQIVQLGAVLASGLLCGLAGAYLSVATSHVWVEGMVASRGWVAVALVIFARWNPARALVGALVFGSADALVPRLQAVGADIPVYLMMTLPYLLTLLVLVIGSISGRRSGEPAFLGRIYLRQDKH